MLESRHKGCRNPDLELTHPFKTKPFNHQMQVWEQSRDASSFAVFWEQGTGKTKVTIDTLVHQFLQGTVDTLLVIAPGGVDRNWITDELPAHLPDELAAQMMTVNYKTKKSKTRWHQQELAQLVHHKGLSVLTMSYDAFVTKDGKQAAWNLMRKRKVFMVLDEAHAIKTPGALRTKAILSSGKYVTTRRILTGTPVAQGPFDVYSQMKFLDEDFWKKRGIYTFTAFKQHFGVWTKGFGQGRQFDVLEEYKNLDELYEILQGTSSRVLKEDVLDLPPKLYSKRYFEMSPEQCRLYNEMKRDFSVEIERVDAKPCSFCSGRGTLEYDAGEWGTLEEPCADCRGSGLEVDIIDATLPIVRLLRMQQITCGYLPTNEEDGSFHLLGNSLPRLDSLVEWAEPLGHKAIVWSRFSKDIDLIMDALGSKAVRYDGKIDEDACERSKNAFQKGDAQFFVGNPAKGATGLTLHAARSMFYYTNNFKLIDRLQSEDRAHRIGQEHPVGYTDLVALCDGAPTVDNNIVTALRAKLEIASIINGDRLKEWL